MVELACASRAGRSECREVACCVLLACERLGHGSSTPSSGNNLAWPSPSLLYERLISRMGGGAAKQAAPQLLQLLLCAGMLMWQAAGLQAMNGRLGCHPQQG